MATAKKWFVLERGGFRWRCRRQF